MGWDAPWHWVIVAIIVIALFGYKKLPDASRSLGRSLRIFKTEIKGMSEDDKARDARDAAAATPAVVTPVVVTKNDVTPPPATPTPAPAEPITPSVVETPVTTPAANGAKRDDIT